MRLQLIVALVALPVLARAQHAREPWSGDVVTKSSAYLDDDDTSVTTWLLQGGVQLPAGVAVGGHILVDAISTASVDVVSAATPGFEETRVETGATLRSLSALGELGLTLVRSAENDWESRSLQLGYARDLAGKNARLQLAYGYTGNEIGRSGDANFEKTLAVHTVELGGLQLLDGRTVVGATYTLQLAEGYQSSPYRFVSTADGRFALLETHPAQRRRHALSLRLLRLVGEAGVEGSYRLYLDDWGIVSHTLAASVTWAFGERWDLRLRARGYRQGAADFWHEVYAQPMAYMSADRELSTFWSLGGGGKLAVHLGGWTVDAKLDVIGYGFVDFARLDGRTAIVGDLGVGYAW